MTLKVAVSNILDREVSDFEAQVFANNQFGVLCAYIRAEAFRKINEYKYNSKEVVWVKDFEGNEYSGMIRRIYSNGCSLSEDIDILY
jgi:hypothetical protein